MKNLYITEKDFGSFLNKLIKSNNVVGPAEKNTKFVFSKLEGPGQLRLDYDVTILPPKKLFFPTNQDLLHFDKNTYKDCIKPQKTILLGVHFYDIKAIDMTDFLFKEKNEDWNYLANRCAATIVGSNIQSVSPRAFWASIGTDVKPIGHDAFLTKIEKGYVFDVLTKKGEALVKYGKFKKAVAAQIDEARKINDSVLNKCHERLDSGSSDDIAKKVRAAFGKEDFWKQCAEDCFSCGSCNIVCPTCYCFDVQDNWNMDQVSGKRTRSWDGCLTEDFAKVSLGAGATENFREDRGERFRHRIMRKASYLNPKLGGPACVGCGRCSIACTSDIADPAKVVNKILEGNI
jgi:sulfhydrogenase subunit beta (sulfur reductase)